MRASAMEKTTLLFGETYVAIPVKDQQEKDAFYLANVLL